MRSNNVSHGPQDGLRKALAVILALCLISFLAFSLVEDVWATVKPPVQIILKSDWVPEEGGPLIHVATKGEVVNIDIEISSGIDMNGANFDLILPEGWEFVGGDEKWQGKLTRGQKIKLKATVRAASDKFGIIKGELNLSETGTSAGGLLDLRDPETTGRVPEGAVGGVVPAGVPTIFVEDVVPELNQGNWLEQLLPRRGTQTDTPLDQEQPGSMDANSYYCTPRAYGRLGYYDNDSPSPNYIGISGAKVSLMNGKAGLQETCATDFTGWNGEFDLAGNCTYSDPPDIYIQVDAERENYVRVAGGGALSYFFRTETLYNFCGTMDFGEIHVSQEQAPAWHLYNQVIRANSYIRIIDGTAPPMVLVVYPGVGNQYQPGFRRIDIWDDAKPDTDPAPFTDSTIFHEYGHHIMYEYAVSPSPDYCNEISDPNFPNKCGHGAWAPEKDSVHWTEGWPSFFQDVQGEYWGYEQRWGQNSTDPRWLPPWGCESHVDDPLYLNTDMIEGFTAAILWDIYDSDSDNQHGDASYDNLSLGFVPIWNVTTNYVPPGGAYNYPVTIHEFWDGFYAWYPEYRQGLCSIFAEHHIIKDTTPPNNPTSIRSTSHQIGVWSYDGTIDITWSGASDDLCGIRGYSLSWSEIPLDTPDEVMDTEGTSATGSIDRDSDSVYFHIRTVDCAGNWSAATVHQGPFKIDTTRPSGTISINGGAIMTTNPRVTLTLSCTDSGSGCDQMSFSNDGFNWSPWEPYNTTQLWVLSSGSGNKMVYARYMDKVGNHNYQFSPSARILLVMPDLWETSVSNPQVNIRAGGSFEVTDTVMNIGNWVCEATLTRYYLSLSPAGDASRKLLDGSRSIPVLSVNGTSTGTTTVGVPRDTVLATYYLLACADYGNAQDESNEANNCIASSTTVRVSLPDYVEGSVIQPRGTLSAGGTYPVTDTATNAGFVDSGDISITRYYLSLDTVKNKDYLLAGSRQVPALRTRESHPGTADVTVPAGIPSGRYYVLACADHGNAVAEIDESNNCFASSGAVQLASPDYMEAGVTFSPNTILPGDILRVTDNVLNQGDAASAVISTARYYLSLDKVRNKGDYLLDGTRPVPKLGPGEPSLGWTIVTVPTYTPLGVYYLLGCADDTNLVAESNEANNCTASSNTLHVSLPDYVEHYVADPQKTAKLGTSFQVTDTVLNQGIVGSNDSSMTRYYLFQGPLDAPKRGAKKLLLKGTRSVPALQGGGGNSSGTTTVIVPTTIPLGSYYLVACADDTNELDETVETNNCKASTGKVQITK